MICWYSTKFRNHEFRGLVNLLSELGQVSVWDALSEFVGFFFFLLFLPLLALTGHLWVFFKWLNILLFLKTQSHFLHYYYYLIFTHWSWQLFLKKYLELLEILCFPNYYRDNNKQLFTKCFKMQFLYCSSQNMFACKKDAQTLNCLCLFGL